MFKVFYVPGQTTIIDYAREVAPGIWATRNRLLMLPELQISHPGAVLGDEEGFLLDQEAVYGTRPIETTQARFNHAAANQPVSDYEADGQCDTFKLENCVVGNVTRIYAHWEGRYWTFLGLATLPHGAIIERLSQSQSARKSDEAI